MADAPQQRDGTAYYALRPRTPVRAWLLSVLLMVAGAVLLVLGWPQEQLVPMVAGGVVLLAGLVLAILCASLVSSRTMHITFTPDGFEVSGPGYHKGGAWVDVDAVSATPDGSRLVISQGHVDRTFIQAPSGQADAQMRAIAADLSARLSRTA